MKFIVPKKRFTCVEAKDLTTGLDSSVLAPALGEPDLPDFQVRDEDKKHLGDDLRGVFGPQYNDHMFSICNLKQLLERLERCRSSSTLETDKCGELVIIYNSVLLGSILNHLGFWTFQSVMNRIPNRDSAEKLRRIQGQFVANPCRSNRARKT